MDEGADGVDSDAPHAEWIQQIAARGPRAEPALRRLSEAYDKRMLSRARWVYRLSSAEAEEVLQETWLRVWKSAVRFDRASRASPWIWTIFRHAVMDVLRDRARKMQARGETDQETLDQIEDPRDPHAPPALAADQCVQSGFQKFAKDYPEDAEALRLRHLEGWGVEELAAHLGRSNTATRAYLCAARRKLKPYIKACLELLRRR